MEEKKRLKYIVPCLEDLTSGSSFSCRDGSGAFESGCDVGSVVLDPLHCCGGANVSNDHVCAAGDGVGAVNTCQDGGAANVWNGFYVGCFQGSADPNGDAPGTRCATGTNVVDG